jgi:hypothetical protein
MRNRTESGRAGAIRSDCAAQCFKLPLAPIMSAVCRSPAASLCPRQDICRARSTRTRCPHPEANLPLSKPRATMADALRKSPYESFSTSARTTRTPSRLTDIPKSATPPAASESGRTIPPSSPSRESKSKPYRRVSAARVDCSRSKGSGLRARLRQDNVIAILSLHCALRPEP